MHAAYFAHDLNDPAIERRLRLLRTSGADISMIGFRRSDGIPPSLADKALSDRPIIDLGRTDDGKFVERAAKVLWHIVSQARWRAAVKNADVIMARSLEMLAIAAVAKLMHAPKARLVYECLDIHRLMLSDRPVGKLLRALERTLLGYSSLLIVSSPGFLTHYFQPKQGLGRTLKVKTLIVENKVFEPLPDQVARRTERPAGPRWRIGWYGIIRCMRSFEILSSLARRRPDLVEIVIAGRPAKTAWADLDGVVRASPDVTFKGPYRPEHLGDLYNTVHFSWSIDYYEQGGNSDWHLPCRLYEGGRHGAVPIALKSVQIGRWLVEHGLGVVLEDPATELEAFLDALTLEQYRRLEERSWAEPAQSFAFDAAAQAALFADIMGPVHAPVGAWKHAGARPPIRAHAGRLVPGHAALSERRMHLAAASDPAADFATDDLPL